MSVPNLVVFDLYGTLINFGIKNHPYRKILQWARQQGRSPHPDDARTIMTTLGNPTDIFSKMGIDVPSQMLSQFNDEVEQEIESLTLYDDVLPVLSQLTANRIPMAICSNLAQPYGAVIQTLLLQFQFIRCLSYEVGFIKPDREMYEFVVNRSGVTQSQAIFVGDTLHADYDGPKEFGFNARHLVRDGLELEADAIRDLREILHFIR
jgi:HAD superfamily hydrolase (TIGR01549 family)